MANEQGEAYKKKGNRIYVIGGGLCILALVAALIPVILVLQKDDSVEEVATVSAVVTIKNMVYSNELADKDSQEFTNFSILFCDEIKTAFTISDLKDSYDGCVVDALRNGSIVVEFLVIFVSRELPSRESIVPILSIEILGEFTFENSSLTLGEIKQIDAADNPSPKIAYGGNCRVTSSCKTRQAHCIDQQCTCPNPKYIDKSSDSCILSEPTTTAAMPTTTTSTTSSTITLPMISITKSIIKASIPTATTTSTTIATTARPTMKRTTTPTTTTSSTTTPTTSTTLTTLQTTTTTPMTTSKTTTTMPTTTSTPNTTTISITSPPTTTTTTTTTKTTTTISSTTTTTPTTTTMLTTATTLPKSTDWTSWGPWTSCSVTCGSGVHTRYRECYRVVSPDDECVGDYVQTEVCSQKDCPVLGRWTTWTSWGSCDVSCGGGVQLRIRKCSKISSSDIDCVGDLSHEQNCAKWSCPDCNKNCSVGNLNADCDACVCDYSIVHGRTISKGGNPIDGAVISEASAPTKMLAKSNSTGFFTLTTTCVTSSIIVTRFGFQDIVTEVTDEELLLIVMDLEVFPRIMEQPVSKFRLAGENVTFCCSAVSSPNITYYEWFRDSVLLDKSHYQNDGNTLRLSSLLAQDSGTITCRANNPSRAIISAPAILSVKDAEDEFCKDALQQKNVSLPSDCIQANTKTTTYDVGFCLSTKNCRSKGVKETDSCNSKSRSCCVPSRLEFKTLNCTNYNLEVIVVKECSCGGCDAGSVIVDGKAIGAHSGSPLINGEIWLNGEFHSYTRTGMFTVIVKNSVDRVIIAVKDTYKQYLDAIKIIDITDNLSGRISTTIRMLKVATPVVIDSSVDAIIETLPEQNASADDFAEILIPADSYYTKKGKKYSGNVSCMLTYIDPVNTNADDIPGQFEFVDDEGSKTLLTTKGVFNIKFEDESRQELVIDDVIEVSFPGNNDQNYSMWKMNEASGIWESLVVGTESKRRNRRRTAGLIGEIDLSQISSRTWLNIDKARKLDNICFFKIRVYKDDNLSEELAGRTGFKMDFHTIDERKSLTTYKMYMWGSGTTCFPVSCENDIGYIRLYFQKVTLWEDERHLYAVDITDFPTSNYNITDGGKTLKVRMVSDRNGPFYNNEAVCRASRINGKHMRFQLETQYDFTVYEVTPTPNSGHQLLPVDQLRAIQQKVWYPLIGGLQRICLIKINITFAFDTSISNMDYSNTKFNVISQGDNIANTRNFVFGVRGFTVNATNLDTTYCVEYKCSGELEGSTSVVDYTRIKIGIRPPTPLHCHVQNMQSELKNYAFGANKEQRNREAENKMADGFDGYAPTDYGTSFGIYTETTDDPTDRAVGRAKARKRCFDECKGENSIAAFTLVCH